MNKIIALTAIIFALSACGAIPQAPEAVDTVPESPSGDATEAIAATEDVSATEESGLGTIAYNENTRAETCKKQRRTGSHIYQTACDDPDSGSQPVRYGGWHDLGKYAMSGSVRPE
jgi:hypothetical protein